MTLRIDSTKAAKFFADFSRIERLEPFMLNECSLADAAQTLRISKTLMGYWVNVMLELGLIRRVRVERRGRHRVPIYRATATAFHVPIERIPGFSSDDWLERNLKDFQGFAQRSLIRAGRKYSGHWHISCRVQQGIVQVMVEPDEENALDQEAFSRFGSIKLSAVQVQALQLEMRALFEKYLSQAEQNTDLTKDYLYQYLLVEADLE